MGCSYPLLTMSGFLDLVASHGTRRFEAAADVIEQDKPIDSLLVLLSGAVEILRDDVRLAKTSEPGVVFGEMSMLLGGAATATVRTLEPAEFAVVENPRDFLLANPVAALHVAELLARRLQALNIYLIDVKRQYEGHDHLGMVDEVLEALMHQPRRVK